MKERLHPDQRSCVEFRYLSVSSCLLSFDMRWSELHSLEFEDFAIMIVRLRALIYLLNDSSDSFKIWKSTRHRSLDCAIDILVNLSRLPMLKDDQRQLIKELVEWVEQENPKWDPRMSEENLRALPRYR